MVRAAFPLRSVALLVCFTVFANATAAPARAADAPTVKQMVMAKGVGKDVKLKRADGTEVKGRIQSIDDGSVTLRVKGSAGPVIVSYGDVSDVKNPGWPRAAKVALTVGIVMVALGLVARATV